MAPFVRRSALRRLVLLTITVALLGGVGAPVEASVVPTVAAQLPPVPVEGLFTGSPPDVTAQAWILYDATYDRVLAEQDADQRRAMASTTKMMTALLVSELGSPSVRVTISDTAPEVGEAEVDLVTGEVWTVNELLYAMLLGSANDAALAVAEHLGGTVERFVELMNDRAEELGLDDTHFANPHGLDDQNHFSSARDLLTLAQAMMAVDELANIVGTREASLPPTAEGEERTVRTTNRLLNEYPGANGVKTGYTDDAGWTVVASAERDGRQLYVVVMGSPTIDQRFADAEALLEYGFSAFGVVEVIVAGIDYARRRLSDDAEVEVSATESLSVFANRDDAELIELTPAFDGDGAVVIASIGEKELARVPLETAATPGLPELTDAFAWASKYWDWLFGNE
ncbi:MAG: D-alanyl-D-alanine carboxypeptidase family protein [Acidimicrobiia bacterium]